MYIRMTKTERIKGGRAITPLNNVRVELDEHMSNCPLSNRSQYYL